MTPLAQSLARQLVKPIAQRAGPWRTEQGSKLLSAALDDTHFFEVSAVKPLVDVIDASILKDGDFGRSRSAMEDYLFLPAPNTWIEWNTADGRIALHLSAVGDHAQVRAFWPRGLFFAGDTGVRAIASDGCRHQQFIPAEWRSQLIPTPWIELVGGNIEMLAEAMLFWSDAYRYIINSPKIIGRKQHMPHSGLQKALIKAGSPVGRYPLHAWSEILLEARPTFVDDSGKEHEARLTGRKCLHFCRAHVRIKCGKMEIVNSHWRGDPALGIKRTRYKVAPPSDGKGRSYAH